MEDPVPLSVPPVTRTPIVWYIGAVVVLVLIAILSVVAVSALRPTQDNTALIVTIVGVTAPAITSILALMKSAEAAYSANETHRSVNGRLDAFVATAREAAREEGRAEGMSAGRVQANARTDVLANQKPVREQG